MSAADEFSAQWRNPGDILSLLLLIGGDVVQKALAQLFGVYIRPFKNGPRIYLTPVAFSFGWLAYAFASLTSVIGDKQLMPSSPDSPSSIVVNCDTGYARTNQSWLLGRILRDYEMEVRKRPGSEEEKLSNEDLIESAGLNDHKPLRVSLRIDIFTLGGNEEQPRTVIDHVWVLGWLTIVAQLGVSIAPWLKYGDWSIFLITASGTLFALYTGSLQQWAIEKWPGRRLNKPVNTAAENTKKLSMTPPGPQSDIENGIEMQAPENPADGNEVRTQERGPSTDVINTGTSDNCRCKFKTGNKTKTVCITRGNGHRYAMVIICSGTAWDLEWMATATSESKWATPWLLGVLAVAWVCLLICVQGLRANAWFLLLIGGLGMLQNVYASSAPRASKSMGLPLKKYEERPTIIGSSSCPGKFWPKEVEAQMKNKEFDQDDPIVTQNLGPLETVGVSGAIRELEKTIPGAGFSIMPVFFPAALRVENERYKGSREEIFWQTMWTRWKPPQKNQAAT